MSNKETLSPELIAAVKELIPEAIGVDFETLLDAYLEQEEGLTEKDLIEEILYSGGEQKMENEGFEDSVIIGAIALAGPLGLM